MATFKRYATTRLDLAPAEGGSDVTRRVIAATGFLNTFASGGAVPGFWFLAWRKRAEANRSGVIRSLIRGLAVNLTWRKLIVCVGNNYRRKT